MALNLGIGKFSNPANINTSLDNKDKEKLPLEYDIALNMVDFLFNQIEYSLKNNRSKKNINLGYKGFMEAMLPKSKNGVMQYVAGMNHEDIVQLLDFFQTQNNRRCLQK